jgi:hypothetical protein
MELADSLGRFLLVMQILGIGRRGVAYYIAKYLLSESLVDEPIPTGKKWRISRFLYVEFYTSLTIIYYHFFLQVSQSFKVKKGGRKACDKYTS